MLCPTKTTINTEKTRGNKGKRYGLNAALKVYISKSVIKILSIAGKQRKKSRNIGKVLVADNNNCIFARKKSSFRVTEPTFRVSERTFRDTERTFRDTE